jgi:hypothetical protein
VTLLSAAFACAGAWVIIGEVCRVSRARIWPTVSGQVLRSDWSAGAGDSGGASYEVQVEYQYSVSGRQYRASETIIRPTLGLDKARKKGAELRQSYPIGRELPIAYNPKRPEQSEIADNTQKMTNYGMILIGLLVIGLGFVAYSSIGGW